MRRSCWWPSPPEHPLDSCSKPVAEAVTSVSLEVSLRDPALPNKFGSFSCVATAAVVCSDSWVLPFLELQMMGNLCYLCAVKQPWRLSSACCIACKCYGVMHRSSLSLSLCVCVCVQVAAVPAHQPLINVLSVFIFHGGCAAIRSLRIVTVTGCAHGWSLLTFFRVCVPACVSENTSPQGASLQFFCTAMALERPAPVNPWWLSDWETLFLS